jgi:hypothetical protein
MKVGLSASNLEVSGGPEPAGAQASDAEPPEPQAVSEAAPVEAAAEPSESGGESTAAKKKRTRKKSKETVSEG